LLRFSSQKTYGLGVADKAASLMGCESPTANCPIRAVSISDVWRGNELYDARKQKPRRPYSNGGIGRSDLGGEQTWRPEHKGMPAAPKKVSRTEVAVRVNCGEPTPSNRGEGRSPLGRNGQRHRGRRRGMGPSIQGKTCRDNVGKGQHPAGTGDNLQRPTRRDGSRGGGRMRVWRMSP
jgi:hypothetical protein